MARAIRAFFLVAGGVLLLGAFVLIDFPAQGERLAARRAYERARADFTATTARKAKLEHAVAELHRRPDTIRLTAREEYRMVRPGEHLAVVRSK